MLLKEFVEIISIAVYNLLPAKNKFINITAKEMVIFSEEILQRLF